MSRLVRIITSTGSATRDQPLEDAIAGLSLGELLEECRALDHFRRESCNLYDRVRALLFLHAIHRYHVANAREISHRGVIPQDGVAALHDRAFERAIEVFLAGFTAAPSEPLSSALAVAYRALAFQTLADQVKQSVRSVDGNAWMFQIATPADHPLRARAELLADPRPTLREETPVRMDLTHSAWSDIFFLGMDHPDAARVLNISIDLGVRGRDPGPRPPIATRLRVLDRPVLELVSSDLGAEAEIRSLDEVFDFARDYLGLIKAAVIAAGLIPPSLEASPTATLEETLARVFGEGRGVRIESHVRAIPKGSRLAVSTHLLASLIALIMRATGQTRALTGPLEDQERRLIVARAILGEWLGGSGGGWQDSGGLWPGIKRIEGAFAAPGDPEHGISRGRLLPDHTVLDQNAAPKHSRDALQRSLVLVHGGMAQNVGPVLEMVTEKYLLRSQPEWDARNQALSLYAELRDALKTGDVARIGQLTHRNFHGPITTIIPWATNDYTATLIARVEERFGASFLGFWMLGGMAGGGMGFLFDPTVKPAAEAALGEIMLTVKREMESSLPFAMDPVVYDFSVNVQGSVAALVPTVDDPAARGSAAAIPVTTEHEAIRDVLTRLGFDRETHEEIRSDLRAGRIGLRQNRISRDATIEDAAPADVEDARGADPDAHARGTRALEAGSVAMCTLAAGVGSRWTQGAGVVKALNPFCQFAGRHRSFLEVHLAKTRKTAAIFGVTPLHLVTTSHLTHGPIDAALARLAESPRDVRLSPGRSIGLRMIPTERDLRFLWEHTARQRLDEQAQKVKESAQAALIAWALREGEGADYTDNLPDQCLHPVGHFYEVPNLLLNGVLADALEDRPQLQTLLLHNIDTLGADLDPTLLGRHLRRREQVGTVMSFEVVTRRIEDQGGGLARVDGQLRLIESLALPREEDEFKLSYYNSMTTWIDIDGLLDTLGLTRDLLRDDDRVHDAVRDLARRLPTYVTLKDVKKRWGHGHEDIYPVTQFEKLWGDMTALPDLNTAFLAVERFRGQQLKDPAQQDSWLRDGSKAYVEARADFDRT